MSRQALVEEMGLPRGREGGEREGGEEVRKIEGGGEIN
jgi:hypothetical protein